MIHRQSLSASVIGGSGGSQGLGRSIRRSIGAQCKPTRGGVAGSATSAAIARELRGGRKRAGSPTRVARKGSATGR